MREEKNTARVNGSAKRKEQRVLREIKYLDES